MPYARGDRMGSTECRSYKLAELLLEWRLIQSPNNLVCEARLFVPPNVNCTSQNRLYIHGKMSEVRTIHLSYVLYRGKNGYYQTLSNSLQVNRVATINNGNTKY